MELLFDNFDDVYLDSFLILEMDGNTWSNTITGSMELQYDRLNDNIEVSIWDVKYLDEDENIIRKLTKDELNEVKECIKNWFTGREEDYFSDNSDFTSAKSKRYEFFE